MLSEQIAMTERDTPLCKFCRGSLVCDPNSGERICGSCGIVSCAPTGYSTRFSRSLALGLETELVGSDPSSDMMYEIDLPAAIDARNVDAHGKGIYDSYEVSRLRRLNSLTITRDSKLKSFSKAVDTIQRVAETLSLGETVAERAFQIYRKCNGNGLARRRAIIALAMASVCVACKEMGIARSAREIEGAIAGVNPLSVRRQYGFLLKRLGISVTTSDPLSFISRIASRASVSGKIERKAIQILLQVKDDPVLISKKPVPLAASALYLSSQLLGEPVTQLRIACAAEITPVTIRKRSLEIWKILESKRVQTEPEEGDEDIALEQALIAH
jgi:transcription initiation factor TFIIB